MMEPLIRTFTVQCDRAAAFGLWTERATLWWPKSHKMTRDPGAAVRFEPRVGGRIYERASDGREIDWGTVSVWDPPARLAYSWHIGFAAPDATQVEVRFSTLPAGGTAVEIRHSGWERLGDRGPERRRRNAEGWSAVISACQEAAG